jgi:hypothetical protein
MLKIQFTIHPLLVVICLHVKLFWKNYDFSGFVDIFGGGAGLLVVAS